MKQVLISNIQKDKLTDVFDKWLSSDLAKSLNCHCSEFSCLGPNVLVKNMYYPNMDFKDNERHMHKTTNYTILKRLIMREKHFIDK